MGRGCRNRRFAPGGDVARALVANWPACSRVSDYFPSAGAQSEGLQTGRVATARPLSILAFDRVLYSGGDGLRVAERSFRGASARGLCYRDSAVSRVAFRTHLLSELLVAE